MSRARRLGAAVGGSFAALLPFALPPDRPLPFEVCLLHRLTGARCLTCGLTRSVCAFAHGGWRNALDLHPAGGLVLTALVLTAAWLVAEAALDRPLAAAWKLRTAKALVVAVAALSIVARAAGR